MKNRYLETGDLASCYGCMICEVKCPVNAICFKKNEHGFLYPKVDNDKCIECGICRDVCPMQVDKLNNASIIYQVAHKNVDVLLRSQCGGAFTAISDYVLNTRGVVYGVILDETDLVVKHIRADRSVDRDKMRGSKYVQSLITKELIFQIEKDLVDGKVVLFSGTPCQCAMVQKNYGQYDNLIVCDFICHGVPSPDLWKRYLQHISEKYGMKIAKAVFRNKRCRRVGNHTESFYSESGEEYLENDYAALFYSHLAHRNSCFECQFASLNRYSDITIGGFLEPSDFKAEYDSSMLLANTVKGEKIFDMIRSNLYYEISTQIFYKNQPCLYHPIDKPDRYEEFWRDWDGAFERVIEKYATDSIKDKYHIRILDPGENY